MRCASGACMVGCVSWVSTITMWLMSAWLRRWEREAALRMAAEASESQALQAMSAHAMVEEKIKAFKVAPHARLNIRDMQCDMPTVIDGH